MWWLAILECAIGLGFLFNVAGRLVLVLFLLHMLGTFVPLFVLPEFTFKFAPFGPTFEGQYILKNTVFLAAGLTVLWPSCFPRRRLSTMADHQVSASASPSLSG